MLVAIMMYVNGIVLTMLTDVQKYLVLRERKGLINHTMVGWSRNMNYVGEMTLYGSFAVCIQKWEVWAIYSWMWGFIFCLRMSIKDWSLAKKVGADEYFKKTWMFVPKIYNSAAISAVVYTIFFGGCYLIHENGGLEKSLKMLY